MGYEEYISSIIASRGQWNIPEGEYYEKHHIVPECMGGCGSRFSKAHHDNIIYLYPQEHYEAHRLLYIENEDNEKLFYAWRMMSLAKPNGSDRKVKVSAEDYETLKKEWFRFMCGDSDPRAKKVICLETRTVFNSAKEAAEATGGNRKIISAVCKGTKRTHKGFHWAFYSDVENIEEWCERLLNEERIRWHKAHRSEASLRHLREMQEANRGKRHPSVSGSNNVNARKCIDVTEKIIYGSMKEAADSVSGTIQGVYDVCKGRSKTHRGHVFKYYEEA